MNLGINFSFKKPSVVCLGRKDEAPSAFLPAHLSEFGTTGSCRLSILLPALACSWGSLQQHYLGFLSGVSSPLSCVRRN